MHKTKKNVSNFVLLRCLAMPACGTIQQPTDIFRVTAIVKLFTFMGTNITRSYI